MIVVDLLPLRGTIPDMTADSTRYIQLQHVYHGQADDDVAIVTEKVRKIEQSIAKVRFMSIQIVF